MDARIVDVLEHIRGKLDEGCRDPNTGDGLSTNTYDVGEDFFNYLHDCAEKLQLMHDDLSADKAFDLLVGVGELLHEKGLLPPFPHDNSNDAEIARWLGAAKSRDFSKYVHRAHHLGRE
jgi:hypothetical protein